MATGGLIVIKVATAIWLMLFLQKPRITLAEHMLEIFVYQYVNPTHKSGGGQCCDENRSSTCTDECDNLFHFCLRPSGYPQTSYDCPWGNYSTVSTISDRIHFNFSEHEPLSIGVPNPLVFIGSGDWPGSFQLLVTVTDKDSNSSDLVDTLYIEVAVPVSNSFTPNHAYVGTARWAFMYLSTRATNIAAPSSIPCNVGCSPDVCHQEAPCHNGATCTNVGVEAYHCLCPQGYRGVNCSRLDSVATGHNYTSTVAVRSIPVPSRSRSTGESTATAPPPTTTTGPSQPSSSGVAMLAATAAVVLVAAVGVLAAVARSVALYTWRRRNTQKDGPITTYPNPAYARHDVQPPNQSDRQSTASSHYYTTPDIVTRIQLHAPGAEGGGQYQHASEGDAMNTCYADEGLGLEKLYATPGSVNGSYVNEGLGPDWSKTEVYSTPYGGAHGMVTAEGSEVGEYDDYQYEHMTAGTRVKEESEYNDPSATFENPYVKVVS